MLTLLQAAELTRGTTLQKFLTDNKDIFKNFIPFKNKVATLFNHIKTLTTQASEKDSNTVPGTELKFTVKKRSSTNFSKTLSKTEEYYKEINDTENTALVHYTYSDIFKIKDADFQPFFIAKTTEIYTPVLMADPIFITYNITALTISDLLADAALFNSKIGDAKLDSDSYGTVNDNIDATITLIHNDIDSLDNLISEFELVAPDFVTDYHKSSALAEIGVHHSGIEGDVTKSGKPFSSGQITIVGTGKIAVVGADGKYSIICVKPGTYTIKADDLQGNIQTILVHIRRGHIETINFDF